MPNYTLDLSTILAVFHAQRRTGELRAENVRLRNRGGCQVQIAFYNGKDVSYLIEDASGQPFAEGDTAKQLLMRLERIEWKWTPQQVPDQAEPITRPLPQYSPLDLVFRRNERSLSELSTLPRPYQRLLLLVDGQRTVAQLAALFPGTSRQEIYRVLLELQKRGWLTLA